MRSPLYEHFGEITLSLNLSRVTIMLVSSATVCCYLSTGPFWERLPRSAEARLGDLMAHVRALTPTLGAQPYL